MLQPFEAHTSGRVVGSFSEGQADILRFLLVGHLNLLDEEDPLGDDPDPLAAALGIASIGEGPVTKPENPALARLFPDAYGDDDAAGEFRRLTEPDLREGKRGNARTVLKTLDGYEQGDQLWLDGDLAKAWLGALNDIRLVLSVWLEIADDDDDPADRIDPDDDRYEIVAIYQWLGLVLQWLVDALMDF